MMFKSLYKFYTASIKRQLILGIALVHAVMMTFFVIDLVEKEKDFLINQHNEKAKSLSKTLATASTSWLLANDFIGLNEVTSSIKNFPDIEYIMVLNLQGQVVSHSKENLIGKYISDKKSLNIYNGEIKTKIVFENEDIIDVVTPIQRDKQHIGWARLALSKQEITQGLYNATTNGIVYTILAIFVGIIFAYFMAKGLTSSVYEILETIKQIKKGNSTQRTKIRRIDEIGHLSKEFDKLLDTLDKSKKEIKKINEIHELTLDGLKDGLWDWDIKTNKTYFSKNWKKMIGYNENELENKAEAFFELIHPDDKTKIQNALYAHFENPKLNNFSEEIRLKCKDNTYKWILTRGNALFDKDKEAYRMLGFHTDITKDKEKEEYIKKQDKIMYEQSKMASMGEMIGNIAHQWRQPLNLISTSATGLKMAKELNTLSDEQFIQICDTIKDNTKYLSHTIDDFRNFIKGDRKDVEFNLNDTIESFFNLINPSIKNHNINVIKNLEEDIHLVGHPNELIQCLINIFNNSKDALDYIENDRYLFISTIKTNKEVTIRFRDNAKGIPNSVINRIFEPYFTTKHKSQGTGLGLHMTYKLISEGMHGKIYVENVNYSFENKKYIGAEFVIILPIINNER